jgi:hypothetical protein
MNSQSVNIKIRRKDQQDQRIANRLTAIQQVFIAIKDNPDAMLALSERGYPDLDEGFFIQEAAFQAYVARNMAMAAQSEATAAVIASKRAAREAYSDFRKIARVVFKDDITRTALGLTGRVPVDRARFIHLARAGFEAALTPDYAPTLARRGLSQPALEANLASLDALLAADEAQIAAKAAARQATANRTLAVARLDAWFGEFRGVAKVAFRHHPEWIGLLKIR